MSKKCPIDKIVNPASGRCVKRTGKIGKELIEKKRMKPKCTKRLRPTCPKDKILNPASGRCVKRTGKIGKELIEKKKMKNKTSKRSRKRRWSVGSSTSLGVKKEFIVVENLSKNVIEIYNNDITWEEFLTEKSDTYTIDLLKAFEYVSALDSSEYVQYYIRSNPITLDGSKTVYFEIAPATGIDNTVNHKSFSKYINQCENNNDATSFWNPSKDARLIIPCSPHAHIARFNQDASLQTQINLWNTIKDELLDSLQFYNYVYLTTHGHGVSWLHFRIEHIPKYWDPPYEMERDDGNIILE